MVDSNRARFDGQVEVLVDQKLHLWADHVTIDKKSQELVAWADVTGAVLLEDPRDNIITADRVVLNFIQKTGAADNMTIRVARGYISTSKAEKANDQSWYMHNMMYTPCDDTTTHWDIRAGSALLNPNGLLKAKNILKSTIRYFKNSVRQIMNCVR